MLRSNEGYASPKFYALDTFVVHVLSGQMLHINHHPSEIDFDFNL